MANFIVVPKRKPLPPVSLAIPGLLSSSAAPSLEDALRARRAAMEKLAAGFRRVKPQLHGASLGSFLAALDRNHPPRGVSVLEGLGAFVVSDVTVDVGALRDGGEFEIIADQLICLPAPIARGVSIASSGTGSFWHLQSTRASVAHAKGYRGRDVLIGVLDTGIDATHEEFAGKTVHYAAFEPGVNDLEGILPKDYGDHGTHVSAIIAGQRAGIAPAADLAVAAVLTIRTPSGTMAGYTTQIARGLNWLTTRTFRPRRPGVDIVNASLGCDGYDNFLYSVLSDLGGAFGVNMVAAIGNSGLEGADRHDSPGNYDIVIGVGAHEEDDRIADYSDWGLVTQHPQCAKPDLSAPGSNVGAARVGGGYHAMSGTSMASPCAAGALALVLERYPELRGDPNGQRGRLLELIRGHRVDTAPCRGGTGLLDLTSL